MEHPWINTGSYVKLKAIPKAEKVKLRMMSKTTSRFSSVPRYLYLCQITRPPIPETTASDTECYAIIAIYNPSSCSVIFIVNYYIIFLFYLYFKFIST